MQIINAEEFKKSYDKSYQTHLDNCIQRMLSEINKLLTEIMEKHTTDVGYPIKDLHFKVNSFYNQSMIEETIKVLEKNGYKAAHQVYNHDENVIFISI